MLCKTTEFDTSKDALSRRNPRYDVLSIFDQQKAICKIMQFQTNMFLLRLLLVVS